VHELVELSATAAKEGARTCAELQSAALDAARELPGAADGARRALGLLETDTQILTRSTERLQASTQQASREIQEAFTACMTRMRDLSGRN
jgi:hypothetical protein